MKDIGLLIEEITRKGFDEDTRSAKEIIEKHVKETEEFLEKNNREDFDLKYQRLYHMVKFFTIFIKSERFQNDQNVRIDFVNFLAEELKRVI